MNEALIYDLTSIGHTLTGHVVVRPAADSRQARVHLLRLGLGDAEYNALKREVVMTLRMLGYQLAAALVFGGQDVLVVSR